MSDERHLKQALVDDVAGESSNIISVEQAA